MKTTFNATLKKASGIGGIAMLLLSCLGGAGVLAQGNREHRGNGDNRGNGERHSSIREQPIRQQQSQGNTNSAAPGAFNHSRGQNNQNTMINRPVQRQFDRGNQNRGDVNRFPSQTTTQGANRTIPDRNIGRVNDYNRNLPQNTLNRPVNDNRLRNNNYSRPDNNYNRQDRAYNGRGNNYYNGNRGYGNYRRPVYNSRNPNWRYAYAPRRNSVFNSLPSSYFSINFGGFGYRYYDGIFYRPYNNIFRVVAPPIGIYVSILPIGYSRIYVRDYPYYYYNGTYYDYQDDRYTVVSPPVGAIVESIPDGFETLVVDGETYYVADGAQYKPVVQDNGEIWYEVIKANT